MGVTSHVTDNTLVIMKNECLWGVDIELKILMRKVKSLLKQTTPLQICSASFLNSPEHKKPTNILRKNTLPISLFTDCSLQIKFLPFLKSWPATIYWGKKDDKLGNKTRLKIERKIEIYICKSISKFWLKCMHQKQK